jgi:hypothetical protein
MKKIFSVPVRTVSEANIREHWAVRARRAKRQRGMARLATARAIADALNQIDGAEIHLVRIGARALDTDNLARALKAVRDGIADAIGIDDGDERLAWTYGQQRGERGKYSVLVEITFF